MMQRPTCSHAGSTLLRRASCALPLLLLLGASAPPPAVLPLKDAEQMALANQPSLRQAHAQTEVAQARADQARAPLLPQVSALAKYQRTTLNSSAGPDTPDGQAADPTADSYNNYNLSLSASQLIYDFGQTGGSWRAARRTAQAQERTEQAAGLDVLYDVRTAFFTARAEKSLMDVARQTVANEDKHLQQVQGFVEVGTRPAIDLAQSRLARSNAQLQLIQAENGYATARAQLSKAMGVDWGTRYEVADDTLETLAGEDSATEALLDEALNARPEYAALKLQVAAQEQVVRSARGGYFPSLSAGAALSDSAWGGQPFAWNWSAGVNLSWALFTGFRTTAEVREQQASLKGLEAQKDVFTQSVRLQVEQARLAVVAAKAALATADDALANAAERLRLAEGRYETGVGNIIELGDAQLAQTSAAAQKVQSAYNLALARAQLLRALGRS